MKKTVFEDGSWIEEMDNGTTTIHDDGRAGAAACRREALGKISYGQPAPALPVWGRLGDQ
jgi:hypothetical protein